MFDFLVPSWYMYDDYVQIILLLFSINGCFTVHTVTCYSDDVECFYTDIPINTHLNCFVYILLFKYCQIFLSRHNGYDGA